MQIIEASKFNGKKIDGLKGISRYCSEYYDDRKNHRVAERAIDRARKIGGYAYAIIDGRAHQMREFNGEVPDGWAEIYDRYELDGRRYYLNASGSHYLTMIDRGKDGQLLSYMPTIAVKR